MSTEREARWREALDNQVCPVCGCGPFRVVLIHLSRVHDLDRFTARERAGLTKYESILTPEEHAIRSAIAKDTMPDGPPVKGTPPGSRHAMSGPGRRAQQARVEAIDPEVRRRSARVAARARVAPLRPVWKEAAEAYAAEVARLGRTYGAVRATADRLGVSESAVRRRLTAARRRGLDPQGG